MAANVWRRLLRQRGPGELKGAHGAAAPNRRREAQRQLASTDDFSNRPPINSTSASLESRMIRQALERADGSKPKAAALLRISECTLWHKVKKYLRKDED